METPRVLYGLEPDLGISHPDLLVNAVNDIILPKYFHTQLQYLKNSNLSEASSVANKILDSLNQVYQSEIVIYKNGEDSSIYFVYELTNNLSKSASSHLDLSHALDRYLLTLDKLFVLFEAQVFFCTQSFQTIQKCQALQFTIIKVEDWNNKSQLWLQQETIENIMNNSEQNPEIQWQEQETEQPEQPEDGIYFREIETEQPEDRIYFMNVAVSNSSSSSVPSNSNEEPPRQLTEQEILLPEEQREQRRQQLLTEKAQAWLNKLDPNTDEGKWFEEFSHSFDSKLHAAIVYLESMREAGNRI